MRPGPPEPDVADTSWDEDEDYDDCGDDYDPESAWHWCALVGNDYPAITDGVGDLPGED